MFRFNRVLPKQVFFLMDQTVQVSCLSLTIFFEVHKIHVWYHGTITIVKNDLNAHTWNTKFSVVVFFSSSLWCVLMSSRVERGAIPRAHESITDGGGSRKE